MSKPFDFLDLGRISYEEALSVQTAAFDALLAEKAAGRTGTNKLFFCEHEPVFTLGKHGHESNLLVSEAILKQRGISYYHTNRGGDITYHGPGQITGYPVFDLEQFHIGLKLYIERLEHSIIRFLASYGLQGGRVEGAAGVWLDGHTPKARKICAIGVRSSRFVTMHGFALNISTDLSCFSLIHPCGFVDKGVTSLAAELDEKPDFEEAKNRLLHIFEEAFCI